MKTHGNSRPKRSFATFRQRYLWPTVTGCYGLGFLIILRLAYLGQLPGWLGHIPHYDKPLHVVLYAIATFLGHSLLQGKRWRINPFSQRWALPLFPLAFAIFTTMEELSQGLSPNRSLDAIDLICSLVGCWLGYRLAERRIPQTHNKTQQ